MSVYASGGDTSKAVATYKTLSLGLQKDLGVNPSEQSQALYKRIKAGWKPDIMKESPNERTIPPKTRNNVVATSFSLPKLRHSNLPRPLTGFIGRQKEIQQVEHLVSVARMVTITGSGGVGKTRLAIQVSDEMTTGYRDGVWWVELASINRTVPSTGHDHTPQQDSPLPRDSLKRQAEQGELSGTDLVAHAVAKALRIQDNSGLPLLEGILEILHEKQLLLVLDNCEHLIEACAVLVEHLLANCPEVTILATSREALGVPGEKAWSLPTLPLPDTEYSVKPKEIFSSEAVDLFIQRTSDVLPGYRPGEADALTIAQICQRLDGIPLAIELAAARMNLLSAQEILARLYRRFGLLTGGHRTVLPRHQTLLAAIEWSHALLSENEKTLFRRLSIFAGSFTLEAAESICTSDEISSEEVLTLLGRLKDKSLIQVLPAAQDTDLPTRYRLLDNIRSFGCLKLDDADETVWMHDRHAAFYVQLVEAAEPELLLQTQVRWFKLLQAEHDNLRAVVEWGAESDQAENGLRLVGALLWFWFSYGSSREGLDMALKALVSPSAAQYKHTRARALNTAGFLQSLLGDTTSARRMLEESISILRLTDNKVSLAWSLQFLGLALTSEEDYDLADQAFKEGLDIARNLGGIYANNLLHFLGDIDLQKGNQSRAKKIYQESASILRSFGSKSFLGYPLRRLGYLALDQDDLPIARSYFLESLKLNQEIDDKRALAACLTSMAALAIYMGKPVNGARLCGVVENWLESLSVNLLSTDQADYGRIRTQLSTMLDETTLTAAFAQGWELSKEQAIELAEDVFEGESPTSSYNKKY
jgi:predicted ATPase